MSQHHPDFSGDHMAYGKAAPTHATDHATEKELNGANGTDEASVYEMVVGAVERNPLLALGAVAALGAITVMALTPRRPESNVRALERQARRHAADLERRVRSGIDNSGLTRSLEDFSGALAQRLATADLSALEPLGQRASSLLDRALDRVNTALK